MSRGLNSQPGAPALIRSTAFTSDEDKGPDLRRLLPAWIISGVIHVVFLCLFLLVTFSSQASPVSTEVAVVENKIDEDYRDKNLTNEEIGNDPDLPTNYNIDRIAEQSVPGPVNPNETVGILNAPMDAPPATVPPPPGFGGGQGGGVDSKDFGTGSTMGFAGGLGGSKLVPGGTGGRSGGTREKMLKEGGGNTESEAAVARGIGWIVRHQNQQDGHWGLHDFHVHGKCNCANPGTNDDVAATGMGLLPLLGAGEIHRGSSKNNTYAKQVEKALNWLCKKMGPDGQLGGGYAQPIATICLCEAYGMSADPNLRPYAQKAINKIVDWQGPGGGFRYGPKQPGDLSVAAWHVQALKSGQMSGLNVPRATMKGVEDFLDHCMNEDNATYGYTGRGKGHWGNALTAAGLLCRQYTTYGPRHPNLQKGVEFLRREPPGAVKNMYHYYYATQVMHHMASVNPAIWEEWNPRMRDWLIKSQDQGGTAERRDQKGSWDPTGDVGASSLGRLGYTSLCLLTLEVYYRHLPLYKRELGSAKDEPVRNGI